MDNCQKNSVEVVETIPRYEECHNIDIGTQWCHMLLLSELVSFTHDQKRRIHQATGNLFFGFLDRQRDHTPLISFLHQENEHACHQDMMRLSTYMIY